VSVDGVVPEEQLHLVSDLLRRAAVFPEKQKLFCNAKKKYLVNILRPLKNVLLSTEDEHLKLFYQV
jgi:hypothetical protein